MDFIIKDKCNDCPFYSMEYDEWAVTITPCTSTCNLMRMLPEYDSCIITFHEDIAQTIHVPEKCPLREEDFKVSLND